MRMRIKKLLHFELKKIYLLKLKIIILIIIITNIIQIIKIMNFSNYAMYKAFSKAQKFIMLNVKELLISNIILKKIFHPKISVVIPFYNAEKTIKKAVRSIQNQNIMELDIILINDYSSDNSLYIIRQLKKEDYRIKIINNKKNMGTLYSRCIGTLISKGKYIFPLDSDDMILDKDILDHLYRKGNKRFDIIKFKTINVWENKNYTNKKFLRETRGNSKKSSSLYQPQLGDKAAHHYIIWGKFIKSDIYKKSIYAYGKKRYSYFITTMEDGIIYFIIRQFAKSYISIKKYGILHIKNLRSVTNNMKEIKKYEYLIKYIEVLFEFSRNTFNAKRPVISYLIKLSKGKNLEQALSIHKVYILLKNIIKNVLFSKYISNKYKSKIKKIFKSKIQF